ncbi:MAG: hypothetical protein MK207_12425 [Saprospiraceae bacterium]|nr:hypothetical protein [Saprospiraceae bacterium]
MKSNRNLIVLLLNGLILIFLQVKPYAQDVNLEWARSMGSVALDLGLAGTVNHLGNTFAPRTILFDDTK